MHRVVSSFVGLAVLGFYLSVPASMKAERLSPLQKSPDWKSLEVYQKTITHDEFVRLIHQYYAPGGAFWKYAHLTSKSVAVFSDLAHNNLLFTLNFATNSAQQQERPRYFFPEAERALELSAVRTPHALPLAGIKICLDPGHIGGPWARMEERYFVVGNGQPILEAKLALITCRHIAEQLTTLGADVSWTKEEEKPVTLLRPEDLQDEAIEALKDEHPAAKKNSFPAKMIHDEQTMLFYRNAEIGARAKEVALLKPDLTVCIHYNAAPWGNPDQPTLVDKDRLVLFVNGNYSANELLYDDQKFYLLRKLLDRTAPLEEAAANSIAVQMKSAFKIAPEDYDGWAATHHAGLNPYVFSRNLLANRLFRGPVVFVEGPYMNDRNAYARLEAGDYEGVKKIRGVTQKSIYREYADAAVRGLLHYFKVNSPMDSSLQSTSLEVAKKGKLK